MTLYPPDTHSVSLPSFPSQLDQLDIEVRWEEGSPVYCVLPLKYYCHRLMIKVIKIQAAPVHRKTYY